MSDNKMTHKPKYNDDYENKYETKLGKFKCIYCEEWVFVQNMSDICNRNCNRKDKYITKDEVKNILYLLVDELINKINDGDIVNQLSILSENPVGKAYFNYLENIENQQRFDEYNNQYYVKKWVGKNILDKEYTTATREFLKELEEEIDDE